jgi:hypothetical protein
METSAEACWRLSKACGDWAVESRDSATRRAFREMSAAWRRIAFTEEFTSPETIDPPSSESREPTPVEVLASSLLIPSAAPRNTTAPGRRARDCTTSFGSYGLLRDRL